MISAAVKRRGSAPNSRVVGLLWASGMAYFGDGIRDAVIPVLALTITTTPVVISAVSALQQLPFLLFGLLLGAYADRFGCRDIMLCATIVRAGVYGALLVAVVVGVLTIPWLCFSVFLLGVGEVAYDVAAEALLPRLARPRALTEANSLLNGGHLIMGRFVGPPVGSVVVGAVGFVPFTAAFATALVGMGAVLRIPCDGGVGRRAHPSISIRDLLRGLDLMWQHRSLRALAIISTCLNFVISAWWSVLAVFASAQLRVPRYDYGLFLLAGGIGGLLGSSMAAPVQRRFAIDRVLPCAVAGVAVCEVLLGMAHRAVAAGLLLAAFSGVEAVWVILSISLRQVLVPSGLLGRVNAAYRTLGRGAAPLGALTGGVLATEFGVQAPFLLGAPVLMGAAGLGRWALRPRIDTRFSQEC